MEQDNCEDCGQLTSIDNLLEARDSSDGNKYLMCPVCRRKHSRIWQEEIEEHYERETQGFFEQYPKK